MIKTVLAINNKNGYRALKEVKMLSRFKIEYLILHPKEKASYLDEVFNEADLDKKRIIFWERKKRKEIRELFQTEEFDLLLSVNFGYIFKQSFLNNFVNTINLHTSYLPYNRGAHPNVWPIIDGTPAGVTLHTMDAEIDKGKIIYQEKVTVDECDTGKTLYKKLEEKSMIVLNKGLTGFFNGTITPFIPSEKGTYHSHQDFLDLFEIHPENCERIETTIKKLKALSYSPYKNAFYLNSKGEKVFLDIIIEKE